MSAEAEARLQKLVTSNQPGNRAHWAREWKKGGGRVVGIACTYVPVEVLVAAGIMPWRVSGTWSDKIDDALVIRSANSCGYCNHVLQSLLDNDMDFLDGVVATTWEQDITRLWDVWRHLGKTDFTHILHLPHCASNQTIKYYAGEISEFVTAVEGLSGKKITDSDLAWAVEVCNRRRSLMLEVYEMRKQESPPLSGAEMVGLTTAGTLMPVDRFNQELSDLLPYIRVRQAKLSYPTTRILVSSDFADNPAYVEVIEDAGCVVAMDDFDTGSRYYSGLVELDGRDPQWNIAHRYLGQPGPARMVAWDAQIEQTAQWVKEYNIHGVIELAQRYSRSREMRRPYFLDRIKQAGIQAISLEREYISSNMGQIRNRVQAFLEMVEPES
ncbi:MAG: 2-hydroxyacyl-CoA dehydratase family protein [Dehalococcoidia bacterium]|nr:2-hydroxyacyl-CoA dehydratase family protein [Dehalococcoidia bacterium]